MEEDNTAEQLPTREVLTGHQWGDDLSYIGPYNFERNLDQMNIHLPPRTILKAPPTDLPEGKEAAINATFDGWIVRDVDLSWMVEASAP
ncbi:hypothetical protein [Variovorax sp. HJSM1_2]|uniref:hypothetical protein n=1 Tax=Variovorax sp. HJSM1_2 TaxID=3366263 RepID=UPI003BE6EAEA